MGINRNKKNRVSFLRNVLEFDAFEGEALDLYEQLIS